MNRNAKLLVGATVALGLVVVVYAFTRLDHWNPGTLLFWTAFCIASEYFWIRSLNGGTVHSLGASAKLSTIFILGTWPGLIVFFISTVIANFVVRRSAWYKAVYNGSQLMLSGLAAALVYQALRGPFMGEDLVFAGAGGLHWAVTVSSTPHLLGAFLLAGATYKLVNTLFMGGLLEALGMATLEKVLKESYTEPEEILSSLALVITPLLLILLYGVAGFLGLLMYFAVLGIEHASNNRYVALIQAQESLVRAERMAAMGDLAEEVGKTLGGHLEELRRRTADLGTRIGAMESPKLDQGVAIIDENVDHMATLIEGITAFSDQEMSRVAIDLNELVTRTVEFVRPQNRFDGVEILLRLDPGIPSVVLDGGRIQQVLINLLANAADALKEHGSGHPRIGVRTHRVGDSVVLHVTDNGPGISQENLPRVFEPHFTTKATGHGFGLATSFKIVASHGGRIEVENLEDGGASFSVQFPLAA